MLQSQSSISSLWLSWQCKMISDIKFGAVFLNKNEDTTLEMLASWPEYHKDDMYDITYKIATDVVNKKSSATSKITCRLNDEDSVCDVITLPLSYAGKIIGTVVFMQSVRSIEQKKAVQQLFKWGAAWLEATLIASFEEQNQYNPIILNITKLVLLEKPIEVTANELCTLLAKEFSCSRVSLGLMKNLQVHTLAISDQVRFDPRSAQLRVLETDMEEAIDKKELVVRGQTYTIAFNTSETSFGAISFIRNEIFNQDEMDIIQKSISVIAPVLGLKRRIEQSLFTTLSTKFKKFSTHLFGKGNLRFKLTASAIVFFFILINIITIDKHIYASSSIEGSMVQVLVSPYDTYIKSAHFRAGDKVKQGEDLVVLNDVDLVLKKNTLTSEYSKRMKEYQEALALREKAKMGISLAKISQLEAKLELLNEQISRVKIKVPFDGVIISGDLSQSIGAPTKKGEELFEIAPIGDYIIALNVDDYDIKNIRVGQMGTLRLVALPYEDITIVISRITPVSMAKDGGNFFRVEATLSLENINKLSPGMQGVSKVKVGEEDIFWVWTHSIFDRLGLWLWSLGL